VSKASRRRPRQNDHSRTPLPGEREWWRKMKMHGVMDFASYVMEEAVGLP